MGKLLESFFQSLSSGTVVLPTKRRYDVGSEVELETYFPQVAEPYTLPGKVVSEDPAHNTVSIQVSGSDQVRALFAKLAALPAYQGILPKSQAPKVTIEDDEDESGEAEVIIKTAPPPPAEKPKPHPAPEPPAHISHQASTEPPKVTTHIKEDIRGPHPEKAEAHEPAKPHIKEDVRPHPTEATEHKPAEEVRASKPEPEDAPAKQEPKAKPAPTQQVDAVEQLKDWLLIKKKEVKKEEKDKSKETKKEEKEEEKKKELDLEPSADFAQDLVKAMLRTGYYSPDHPSGAEAKAGLFQTYQKAVGDKNELGFTMQQRVGQQPELYITGVVEEPLPLKKLLGATTSELFFPKYIDYFNRKRLVSFSVKHDITKDHFNKFVDIMSDPTVDKGEASESGRLLTRTLTENQITEISALFETDLIRLETNLPWRVQMAIQRLAKDLKVLPMFKNLSKEQIRRMKMQIVQDIQRPLRRPELLKDIILNVYVIAMQVPGIDEEDLEETIILNFPIPMLLPTADYIIKEFTALMAASPADEAEQKLIERRIAAIKRILKKISSVAMEKDVENTDKFLEQLFTHHVLAFEELPESVQEKVNNIKMADEFQKQPPYWLGKFAEARNKEEMDIYLKYFSKIMPILIDRKDWQGLYLITDIFQRIPPQKMKIFAEMKVDNPTRAIWQNHVFSLVRCLTDESAATRKGLEQIILFLGDIGLQGVYDALLQENDPTKRKILLENLMKFGPKALELFRAILKDPAKPSHLAALSLEALGRAKEASDAEVVKKYLKHSRPELRMEAITSIVRIQGGEALSSVSGMVSDRDQNVAKRALAALGGFAATQPEARAKLVEAAFEGKASNILRAQAIHELSRLVPQSDEERSELQKNLLDIACGGEGIAAKVRGFFSGIPEDVEKLKFVSLDMLGKIGDRKALKKLSKLNITGKELKVKLGEVINQLNLRLGSEEEEGEGEEEEVEEKEEAAEEQEEEKQEDKEEKE